MWISNLAFNLRCRQVRTDLRDCHELHRSVMRLFDDLPGENARELLGVLYRVEQQRASTHLLLQSFAEPNFSRLPPRYAMLAPQSKPFSAALEHVAAGHHFRFRLRANPIRSILLAKGQYGLHGRGKRVEVRGEQPCQDWIRRQAEQHGFRVSACRLDVGPPDPRAVNGKLTGRRQDVILTVGTVLFDGLLEVSDANLFVHAIRHGIGRAKSYGQGLLSLANRKSSSTSPELQSYSSESSSQPE